MATVGSGSALAVGVELTMLTTAEGGRHNPIGGDEYPPCGYRPNWGLPGMTPPEQTGAPVQCFGHFPVMLGDTLRAVLIPMFPEEVPGWHDLRGGEELPMYEGARVCGRATVVWIRAVTLPLPESDATRLAEWAKGGHEPPGATSHPEASERERRQLRLMRERLDAFAAGTLTLPPLVNDLEALLDALEETAEAWRDEFIDHWGELEIAYAVADDRRTPLPDITDPTVADAVGALRELIDRHPASD